MSEKRVATSSELFELLKPVLGLPDYVVDLSINVGWNDVARITMTTLANVEEGESEKITEEYYLVKKEDESAE